MTAGRRVLVELNTSCRCLAIYDSMRPTFSEVELVLLSLPIVAARSDSIKLSWF